MAIENENLARLAKEIAGHVDDIEEINRRNHVPPLPAEFQLEDPAIVHRFYFAWNPQTGGWKRPIFLGLAGLLFLISLLASEIWERSVCVISAVVLLAAIPATLSHFNGFKQGFIAGRLSHPADKK